LTLVLAAPAAPAWAVERPFTLREEGTTDFSTYPFVARATGTATHVGNYTKVAYLSGTPDPDDPTILWVDGQEVLTAADGDQLYIQFEGARLDLTTGRASGVQYFVGGTGRFANATGTVEFEVVQDPSGPFSGTTEGVIDY